MKKLAFLTPLNPIKSGISDFSEELLPELSKYFDIDIFVDNYEPVNESIKKNFKVYSIDEYEYKKDIYDETVFQIGNNEKAHEKIYNLALKYKGIIELHDVSLHHMLASITIGRGNTEKYKEIMEYCHGMGGVKEVEKFLANAIPPLWETKSLIFTMNKNIIDNAKYIIVHSDFAKNIVKGIRPDVPVSVVYLHAPIICDEYEIEKLKVRSKLNINKDEIIFSSFGFITMQKRIMEILEVLSELKKEGKKFKYYLVGQLAHNMDLNPYIKKLNLEEEVIQTGFVELEYMTDIMMATDICFNLRYPTQGESSAIIHRLMGIGKCIFVTDIGSFSEYKDILVSINIENEKNELYKKIKKMIKNEDILKEYEKKSFDFALKYCNLENNAKLYRDIIESKEEVYTMKDSMLDIFFEMEINTEILEKLYKI